MTAPMTLPVGRVRHIREERRCSLQEAYSIAVKETLTKAVDTAESVEDLKHVVRFLIEQAVVRT